MIIIVALAPLSAAHFLLSDCTSNGGLNALTYSITGADNVVGPAQRTQPFLEDDAGVMGMISSWRTVEHRRALRGGDLNG